jgi:poly(glycerol-phosphate) alpha-glucosyltransferase
MSGLVKALGAQPGVEVAVIGVHDEYVEADRRRWDGCSLTTVPVSRFSPPKLDYASNMLSCLRAQNPDVVHCHGLWSYHAWATVRWADQARRPFLVSPHGMLDPTDLAKSRFVKFVAKQLYINRLLHGARCISCLSESEAESARAFGLRNPICLVSIGVDLGPSTDADPPWGDAVPSGAKVLLYLGRLNRKKGVHLLLDGWARALRAGPPCEGWHLVIAGWDQQGCEAQLRAQANALGIGGTVCFAGPQFGQAKVAAFSHASAFALPSTSEGLPSVVLEAWASGLPVLMTPQCNIPEGFAAAAALRVETRADDIARALRELCSMTDGERREMGAKGHRLVREQFTWPKAAEKMRSVYEWLLGGGAPPPCVRMD